jgi:3-phenylpropionate/trans-cinnamate dioxygenase ferredoxin reductase component
MAENTVDEASCIVIGASHAGVTLALQLRREGWQGKITLLGAEAELPYQRPPLSKGLLSGEKDLDGIRLRPRQSFEDNGIELMLGKTVASLQADQQTISLADGQVLRYDKLALCTGAQVRTLSQISKQSQVCYLRTAADAARIKSGIAAGRSVVVIGGGYIGLETAAVLASAGISVTVIEAADRVLQRVTGELMSDFISGLHRAHGVTIRTAVAVQSIEERAEKKLVICSDGSRIEVDFVIVGIGVEANSHPSAIYGRLVRLESVQNANDQARIAAANICGKKLPYDTVPWFWSDQYNIKLQMVGLSGNHDEVVCRGSVDNYEGSGFALFYLLDGKLIAADCVNRPKEFMVSKQLVKNQEKIDPELLADESIEAAKFLLA